MKTAVTKGPMPRVSCGDCPIRHRAVCARCEEDELAILDQIKSYKRFAPGDAIIWAGEKMTELGSVVEGVATLSRTLPDGRRQMVGLLLPSDFVGRPGRDTSPFDVVAATELTLCTFRKPEFERLITSTPSIERRLLQMMLDELDSAREWMMLLGRKTAREKIASLLVIIARRQSALAKSEPTNGISFELPITREAMADYLGLTIETVSRQVTALKKSGCIDLTGTRTVRVPDFARLLDEAGDDSDGGIVS